MHPHILHFLNIQGILIPAVQIDHENYDGSGYPENLAGDQIPIGARVLRVCDTYAAPCHRQFMALVLIETVLLCHAVSQIADTDSMPQFLRGIMEEKQTILAAGAGGASKFVFGADHIERVENVKDVAQSSVCFTWGSSSPGRPTIKSMLILSKPDSLAM